MKLADIIALPIAQLAADTTHLYLWVPNALLPEDIKVLEAWGFTYKSNLVWHKIREERWRLRRPQPAQPRKQAANSCTNAS